MNGIYEVSNLGRIRRIGKNILKPCHATGDYLSVSLCKNCVEKRVLIHRIVAETFLENINNKSCINHINGIKSDNRIDNLEWCTQSENMLHAYKTKLIKPSYKKVIQYDLYENFVKEWESIVDVEKILKINSSNISKCCKGKLKTTGGYIWRYA